MRYVHHELGQTHKKKNKKKKLTNNEHQNETVFNENSYKPYFKKFSERKCE